MYIAMSFIIFSLICLLLYLEEDKFDIGTLFSSFGLTFFIVGFVYMVQLFIKLVVL